MDFRGQVIVVTGGCRGIGKAIVDRFLDLGALVHILDVAPPEDFSTDGSANVFVTQGDVSQADQVHGFIHQVLAQSGKIDVLVNNAGIVRDHVIWKMSEKDFDLVLQVNLKGPWLMCREVAPHFRQQQGGRIINLTSRAWLGNFGQSNYAASKGGLVSLTRVLALELAAYHVTVNAVAPGLIDTPLTRSLPSETYAALVAAQPGKEAGTPEDVAETALFLASSEARFITGQVIYVDGGKSIGANLL
jgi:NAD(P)-dependent dehydrogenase (short-subunit alcohol dehydrogenase family)